jgi:hypothetical protein
MASYSDIIIIIIIIILQCSLFRILKEGTNQIKKKNIS